MTLLAFTKNSLESMQLYSINKINLVQLHIEGIWDVNFEWNFCTFIIIVRSNKYIKNPLEICIYESLQKLVLSSEMPKIVIFSHTLAPH
jgi:hypothetical protein